MSQLGAPPAHRAAAVVGDDDRDGAVRWVVRVLTWMVILGTLGVLAAAVLVPRLGGATPYTVLTSSMKPGLPPGTLVVSRPTDVDDIGIGTIVTYQLRSGEPEVVTHRVVAVRTNLRGEVEFQTQGDANSAPDASWVRPEQIRGSLWYAVPQLGRVNTMLSGHQRQIAVYGVAGALGIYAGAMFSGAAVGRLRRRGESS